MKMQLTKGPTTVPAIFPFPDQFGQPILIGFSGMSEIDYMATHLAAAMIGTEAYDHLNDDELIDAALRMALRLQAKANIINQRANQPQEEPKAEKPIILES